MIVHTILDSALVRWVANTITKASTNTKTNTNPNPNPKTNPNANHQSGSDQLHFENVIKP